MKIRNITDIKHGSRGHNSFCGPGAISALTGITAERAAKLIRAERDKFNAGTRGRRRGLARSTGAGSGISFAYTVEVLDVLKQLGYQAERVEKRYDQQYTDYLNKTLRAWDRDVRLPAQRLRPLLIVVSSHFVVVQGDKLVDNQLERIVTLSETDHYSRARIKRIYEITRA